MTHRFSVAGLLFLALATSGTALADAAPSSNAPSSNDAVDAMTLYSQGMAVVADSRTFDLKAGAQTVTWPMASAPAADSLSLAGQGVQLVGFDIGQVASGSTDALSARIGKSVTLTDGEGGHSRQGTLVGLSGDTALVRIDGRIERVPPSAPVLLGWPAGQQQQDSNAQSGQSPVALHLIAKTGGKQRLTLLYQRDAPSWQASYTARFDADSGTLALQANAIIDNGGDTALDAKKAWLVAGQLNRAANSGGGPRPMLMQAEAKSTSAGAGAPQAVGGLYRYPLPGGLHVPAGATRGIALMPPVTLAAKRQIRFENYALSDDGDQREHASQMLRAKNTSDKPLPAGNIRVYAAGQAAQLLGGDQIDDTPAGAPIDLSLGEAFDITGTHTIGQPQAKSQNDVRKITVTLYNASDKAQNVTIIERLPAKAALAASAPKPSGGDANTPQWQVSVPAKGKQTFSYQITLPKQTGDG